MTCKTKKTQQQSVLIFVFHGFRICLSSLLDLQIGLYFFGFRCLLLCIKWSVELLHVLSFFFERQLWRLRKECWRPELPRESFGADGDEEIGDEGEAAGGRGACVVG